MAFSSSNGCHFHIFLFTLASEAELSQENDQHQQEMDPLSDDYCPDDHLTPVEKVEKYFQSEEVLDR